MASPERIQERASSRVKMRLGDDAFTIALLSAQLEEAQARIAELEAQRAKPVPQEKT